MRAAVREQVEVVEHGSSPVAIVWDGRRWLASDEPTPLAEVIGWVTHLPQVDGWRFQGRDSLGNTRVFDVRHDGRAWVLLGVWD